MGSYRCGGTILRTLLTLVATAVLAALPPALARAANLPFTGVLSVQVANLPALSLTASGSLVVNGSGGLGALSSVTLGDGAFSGVVTMPVTDPAQFPVAGILLDARTGIGTLGLGGTLPLGRVLTFCLQLSCDQEYIDVSAPLTSAGTRGVGIGVPPVSVGFFVGVTVQGAPWTTAAITAGSLTAAGFAHGPASGAASSAAAPGGVLRVVTPIAISTSIGPQFPAIATMTLTFVPEPGGMLLVGAGVVGLGWLGRRRAQG